MSHVVDVKSLANKILSGVSGFRVDEVGEDFASIDILHGRMAISQVGIAVCAVSDLKKIRNKISFSNILSVTLDQEKKDRTTVIITDENMGTHEIVSRTDGDCYIIARFIMRVCGL